MNTINPSRVGPILTMLLAGMAGGMAWGIRGQYGHQTGAMIAGVLVGFTIIVLLGRHLSTLTAARAVAMFALGVSVGGSMTYGQTVGLTHDSFFIGNNQAYHWGMLGLAIKGGIWISCGSAMFGMALSGKQYRWWELLILLAAMIGALVAGVILLNRPFDPQMDEKLIPRAYFSHYWYWDAKQDRPRPECWGGLLCSLSVLLVYLGAIKRDWLGFWLGIWGLIGGAIGFPAGQALQAYNAWHGEWIRSLPTHTISDYFNWWNLMETTFGFVMGAVVGLGCWIHRNQIGYWGGSVGHSQESVPEQEGHRGLELVGPFRPASHDSELSTMPPILEGILLLVHLRMLIAWNFQSFHGLDVAADMGVPMIVIPVIAVMTGRYWPFLMSLPIVMLPIAGKTIRQLHFGEQEVPAFETAEWFVALFGEQPAGHTNWDLYGFMPLAIATFVAMWFALRSQSRPVSNFGPVGCITAAWLYFYLNNAFFHSPWPWEEWTGRTVHGAIFFTCAVCMTLAALVALLFRSETPASDPPAAN